MLIKQANNVAPAPVPAQIASAKSIFIANAPGDSFPAPDGGPDRPYNEFYGKPCARVRSTANAASTRWG